MKLTTIDRTNLRMIKDDINRAVQAVAEKYGVSIEMGSASFSATSATAKVIIAVVADNGTVRSPESVAYENYKELYGLKKNLGETFIQNGEAYTIKGLATRSSKYPIIAENRQGKSYKFQIKVAQ